MTQRFLGLAHLTALELPPPALVDAAHAAGFDGVGIRINPGFDDDPNPAMLRIDGQARETRARLQHTGVKVLDVEILRLKPVMDWGRVESMCAMGAWLGARSVLVLGNDPDEGRATQHLGRVCELAAAHGLTAALEFVFFNDVRTLQQAVRMVQAVGRPDARVLVDSLHFFRAGHRPPELDAVDPALFAYAQWCDAGPVTPPLERLQLESRTDRRFPGEGVLPLAELLLHLPPGLALTLEAPNAKLAATLPAAERVAHGMRALRRMLGQVMAGSAR